jgi:hypothetical protein
MIGDKLNAVGHAAAHAAFQPNAVAAVDPLLAARHLGEFE